MNSKAGINQRRLIYTYLRFGVLKIKIITWNHEIDYVELFPIPPAPFIPLSRRIDFIGVLHRVR